MNKKTIFITGATSGIGLKMTEMCIAKGYTVYATGRNESSLKTLASIGAHVIQADLRHVDDINRVVAELPEIDVAILNAGLGISAMYMIYLMKKLTQCLIQMCVQRFI